MTESEAKDSAKKLSEQSPERNTYSWIARQILDLEKPSTPSQEYPDSWEVIRIAIPSPGSKATGTATSKDEQAIHEDPRTALHKNIGPGYT